MSRKAKCKYLWGAAICVLIGLVICMCPIPSELKIKVIYEFGLPTDTIGKMIIRDNANEYELYGQIPSSAFKCYEITYELPISSDIENIELEVQNGTEKSRIRAIEFYNQNLQILRLAPVQISEFFRCIDETEYSVDHMYITYISKNASPKIEGTSKLYESIENITANYNSYRLNLLFYLLVGYGLFVFLVYKCDKSIVNGKKKNCILLMDNNEDLMLGKYAALIGCVLLSVVFMLVLLMAIKSRTYGHPDENVTRMAIDYYLGGWLRPNLNSSWVAGTFSEYGATRLSEHSWYYLVAGKIGWACERLLHFPEYYRVLNVILFGIMIWMAVWFGRQCPWMFMVMLFTPQLWYLFSYATSDGWDIFWSFIVLFELTWRNSTLNRYLLQDTGVRRHLIQASICGIVFSFLLLAKKNYYIILLLAFFILLFRMLSIKEWDKRYSLLKKYICILMFAFLFVYAKYKLDDIMPDVDKENVISGVQIGEEGAPYGVNLDEQGVTLKELLVEWNFGSVLFRSFIGTYGWLQYYAGRGYNCAMLALYMLLGSIFIISLFKYGNKQKVLEAIMVLILFGMLIAILIYWCWHIDFQAQGRYMMPLVFCVGYLCQRNKEIWKNKYYICTVASIATLSLYSFVRYGIFNLI